MKELYKKASKSRGRDKDLEVNPPENHMVLDYNLFMDPNGEINLEKLLKTLCLPMPMLTLLRMI